MALAPVYKAKSKRQQFLRSLEIKDLSRYSRRSDSSGDKYLFLLRLYLELKLRSVPNRRVQKIPPDAPHNKQSLNELCISKQIIPNNYMYLTL